MTSVTLTATAWVAVKLPSGDLHGDVIDIVGTDVGGSLRSRRRRGKGQGAGGAIDTELGRVGAAGEGVCKCRSSVRVRRQ